MGKMEYKVVVTYSEADFINFVKAYQYKRIPFRIISIASKVVTSLSGGLFLIAGSFNIIFSVWELIIGSKEYRPFIGIPIAFIIIGILLLSKSNCNLLGNLMWRNYNDKGSEIKFHFYEGAFTEHTAVSEHKFNYSVIKSIYEDKVAYYLFVDKSNGHIINKSGFEAGDSKQFATFISEQTGQKVNQIKLIN
jgi:hypothetical protein